MWAYAAFMWVQWEEATPQPPAQPPLASDYDALSHLPHRAFGMDRKHEPVSDASLPETIQHSLSLDPELNAFVRDDPAPGGPGSKYATCFRESVTSCTSTCSCERVIAAKYLPRC
jgi:hypothetical protein